MYEYLSGIFTPATVQLLARGAQVTVYVTVLSGVMGLVLGLLSALGRMSKSWPLRLISGIYIEFFRGTPLLVQLFIIYFGLPSLPFIEPMPAFWAGVIGLTLYVGAYYSEIIRGAYNAIPKGQTEAAQVLGLRRFQAFRFVMLPQTVRNAVPALGNQFISLIKDSTLVSVITVNELLLAGRNVISRTFEPMTVYMVVALVYLVFSNLTALAVGRIEKYYNRPYAGSR